MSDEDNNVRNIPPRPTYRADVNQSSAEHGVQDIANQIQQKRLIEWRTAARQDAAIIVERARERVGVSRTAWTPLDADTLHAITDLLLQVQAQEVPRA